jgi:hypothetical protein
MSLRINIQVYSQYSEHRSHYQGWSIIELIVRLFISYYHECVYEEYYILESNTE